MYKRQLLYWEAVDSWILLWEDSINTIKQINAIKKAKTPKENKVFIEPDSTRVTILKKISGKPEAIPANIITEIPEPKPNSVSFSPNQSKNIVPKTREVTDIKKKDKSGLLTNDKPFTVWFDRWYVKAMDVLQQKTMLNILYIN